jgi:hypothetical protein
VTPTPAVKVTPPQWMRLFSERSGCPRAHRLVLWELAAFANEDGEWARPGVRLLADRVGLKKDDTIAPALEWGRRNFWLRRTMRGNWRRGQADVYELTVPVRHAPIASDGPTPSEGGTVSSGGSTPPTAQVDVVPGLTRRESEELRRLLHQKEDVEGISRALEDRRRPGDRRLAKLLTKSRAHQVAKGEDWVV